MDEVRRGSCLCGAISFAVTGPMRPVVACHCNQCRKQSGHFFAATDAPDDAVSIGD
ncbi:MAG: GFA family protein, partial [Salaquimonas sp.]|nr:GFA family protein [Salaquimonas sp.]